MIRSLVAIFAATACFAALPYAVSAAPPMSVPDCTAKNLKLTISGANGEFAGMSHDGFNAIVTNVRGGVCTIARIPKFSFDDRSLHPVPIVRESPPAHMGHGPVMVPVSLKPNASAYSTLRWVSSDAFMANHCASAGELVYTFAPVLTRAGMPPLPLLATVVVHACGAALPAPITFSATNWQPGTPAP